MWNSCPQQYKLNYIDKLGESSGNIHTIFGSAMHETIQHFLDVMYNITKKQAMEIDLDILLKDKLIEETRIKRGNEQDSFNTTQADFYHIGSEIAKCEKDIEHSEQTESSRLKSVDEVIKHIDRLRS